MCSTRLYGVWRRSAQGIDSTAGVPSRIHLPGAGSGGLGRSACGRIRLRNCRSTFVHNYTITIKYSHIKKSIMLEVLDLFCGCGGASCGFQLANYTPVCGVDMNEEALMSYSENFPTAETICGDIRHARVQKHLKEQYFGVDIIVGGPPCQGFSKRNMTANDMRYHRMNNLPIVFAKLAISLQPKIVVMEEVASAQEVVDDVADLLEKAGYDVVQTCLNAADYGVPQSRRRIILVASSSDAEFIPPSPKNVVSAGSALKKPPVPVRGSVVSPYVRDKIQQLQNANTRLIGGNYSVMDLNRPSPTIHTQTLSATGPYTIKRGRTYYTMSPEEAARLQSFPSNFRFIGSSTSVRRQIGNAVPPMLAKAIASGIRIK